MRVILRIETNGERLTAVYLGAEITHKSCEKMHIRGGVRINKIYIGSACVDDCVYGNVLKEKNWHMVSWSSPRAFGIGQHNGKLFQCLPRKMQREIRKIARSD